MQILQLKVLDASSLKESLGLHLTSIVAVRVIVGSLAFVLAEVVPC